MIILLLNYIVTNLIYIYLPNFSYVIFIFAILILSFKCSILRKHILLSMVLYSLNSNLFFMLNNFLFENFKNEYNFHSGITILVILFIFCICYLLIFNKNYNRLCLKNVALFFIMNCIVILKIDFFAYQAVAFIVLLLINIGFFYILFTPFEKQKIQNEKNEILTIVVCSVFVILICISTSLYSNAFKVHTVLWPSDRGVWATTSVPYDTNDWTLKSSYSYSELKTVLSNKYIFSQSNDFINLDLKKYDVILLMTPTRSFSKEESQILSNYLVNGGHIIFIVDHTDLYGHSRAANSFLKNYNIKINYDAVYSPASSFKKNSINDMLFVSVRTMTGCSVNMGFGSHIRSYFYNFISENPDYTRPNFFADMKWTPDDSIGVFPFWGVKRVGNGFITVCTDSTIFSNFALFQPKVLTLLNGLFQESFIYCTVSENFIILFLLCIFLILVFAYDKRYKQLNYIILFIFLFILTKSYIVYSRDIRGFYNQNNVAYIQAQDKMIYEPSLSNDLEGEFSISNVLSNLPRFKIYPYYVDLFDKYIYNINPTIISNNSSISENAEIIRFNVTSNIENISRVYIKQGLSDYFLGSWWTTLDISPYRKEMFQSFAKWVKDGAPIAEYRYPTISLKPGIKSLKLINEKGAEKILNYSEIKIYTINNVEYVYLQNQIWGLVVKDKGKTYIIGGPSLNDKIDADFYSLTWYAVVD